jgi:hypothetical protein
MSQTLPTDGDQRPPNESARDRIRRDCILVNIGVEATRLSFDHQSALNRGNRKGVNSQGQAILERNLVIEGFGWFRWIPTERWLLFLALFAAIFPH